MREKVENHLVATDEGDGRGEHWPRVANVCRRSETTSKGIGQAPETKAGERRRFLFRSRLVTSVGLGGWSRLRTSCWGTVRPFLTGLGRADGIQEYLSYSVAEKK